MVEGGSYRLFTEENPVRSHASWQWVCPFRFGQPLAFGKASALWRRWASIHSLCRFHPAEGDLRKEPDGPGYYLSKVPRGKGFMCGLQEEGGGACQRWYPPTSVACVLGADSLAWLGRLSGHPDRLLVLTEHCMSIWWSLRASKPRGAGRGSGTGSGPHDTHL